MTTYLPHQQRVVDEKTELGEKIHKLIDFMSTYIFATLDSAEQLRLKKQVAVMDEYFALLLERIAAFSESTTDQSIEQEIVAKGLTAARVTPSDIQANINREHYFTANDGIRAATGIADDRAPERLLTFCVLVLKNGFTVTGESACASPENFDAEIGKKIARENAIQKMWPLMGYALKQQLHEGTAS